MRVSSSSRGSANSVISSIRPSSVSVRDFEGDLSAIVGFQPTGHSYYDDTPYEAIIRKGEEERSYYTEALNTATRGSRKEYPLRGAVAWSASQVAIVDMEGGQPELWRVQARAASGTSSADAWPSDSTAVDAAVFCGALNVALNNGTADARAGVLEIDFVADRAARYSDVAADGGIAQGLDLDGGDLDDTLPVVVNGTVNAVAISDPLDHYPLDKYGRPGFHIAAATGGGVSVILPDADNRGERVTDSSYTNAFKGIGWSSDNTLIISATDGGAYYRVPLAFIEAGDGWSAPGGGLNSTTTTPKLPLSNAARQLQEADGTSLMGGNSGAVFLARSEPQSSSLTALLSSTALSGWMPGDCKLALDFNSRGSGSISTGVITDLSPAGNDATVNGTLTAAAVETGADLFALSGWSNANYLEVPYSSDFDMGTGDFGVSVWCSNVASTDAVLAYQDGVGSGFGTNPNWEILESSSAINVRISDGSNTTLVSSGKAIGSDFALVNMVKRGNTLEVWIDGKLCGTGDASSVGSLSNANASLLFGVLYFNSSLTSPLSVGSIALPRVTKGYAPTPEQIRKMYRDEKKLFEENAKCFLPSDTVNSLDARDGLLLVGTEGGAVIHDVFRRLELLDSGDIGLTESGVDSVALLGGDDVALVTGSDVVARRAARDLAHPQVIDAYRYERAFSGKGYTTDATPTDIAKFPLAEGERVELRVTVDAGSDDGSEYGTYSRVVRARRDIGGNVTVTGTDTLGTDDETTAGMDVAFAADTTAQTVDLQVTGVAATNMQWSYEAVLTLNKVV